MTPAALALLRAEPHISVSSITTYLQCAEKFWHRYINHTAPSHRPSVLVFGSAVHIALALFYRRLMDDEPEPVADELAAAFSDAWTQQLAGLTPVLFDKNDSEDSLRDKGVAMIQHFHAETPRPHRVIGVEEPFSIELTDPSTGHPLAERLVGVFDAITEQADGSYEILEHKTAARRFGETRLRFDHQATAYSIAAPAVGLGNNPTVTFQVLLKTKQPALERYTLTRTEQDHQDFIRTAVGVTSAIAAGAFYPVRDWWCSGCPYAGPCLAG